MKLKDSLIERETLRVLKFSDPLHLSDVIARQKYLFIDSWADRTHIKKVDISAQVIPPEEHSFTPMLAKYF